MRGQATAVLASAVVLAACGAHAQSQPPQQVTLALSLSPGSTYRYLVHTSGSMKSGQTGMSMTVAIDLSMRQTYQVVSVDSNGVATVKVTIDQLSGKVGSTSMPIPGAIPSFTVQISRDGSVSGLGPEQSGSLLGGLPFADPAPLGGISAVLPSGAVKPGDHWTKTTTIPGPAGGSIGQITWNNQLLRFDSINGTRVAVIQSTYKGPMDATIDPATLGQAAASFGSASATPPPGFSPPPGYSPPPGTPTNPFGPGVTPTVQLQGTTTGTMTNWVDIASGRLVKGSGASNSNVTESVQGLPSPSPGAFGFGTGSVQMNETQSQTVSPLP